MSMTIAEAFEARGEARGNVNGKVEVAINMLEHSMDIEQIAELTGLDIDAIIKLNQEQDKPTH